MSVRGKRDRENGRGPSAYRDGFRFKATHVAGTTMMMKTMLTFAVTSFLCALIALVTATVEGALRVHTVPVGTQPVVLTLINI